MTTLLLAIAVWFVFLQLLALVRVAKGPTAPDRLVGLDAINTLVIAVMVLLAAAFRETWLVDVAIVYALLSFVGTLFFARHLENKGK